MSNQKQEVSTRLIHFSNNPCVFFPRKAEQKSRPCVFRFKDARERNGFLFLHVNC